jgi:hypothetical protein
MKIVSKLLLAAVVAGSMMSTSALADAKDGQNYYKKKLKSKCKKDNKDFAKGGPFAQSHDQDTWEELKEDGELVNEWKKMCPSGTKKFDKMDKDDINNLYDFVYKYASDGEVPSCG